MYVMYVLFVNSVPVKKDIPSIAVEDAESVDEAEGSHCNTDNAFLPFSPLISYILIRYL